MGERNVSDLVKLTFIVCQIIFVFRYFDLELEKCNEFDDAITVDVMT
jgi:hypothetical protein